MAFFRGEEGSVLFDKAGSSAAAVAGTTAWTLDITKDVLETTDQIRIDCSVADKLSGALSVMEIT